MARPLIAFVAVALFGFLLVDQGWTQNHSLCTEADPFGYWTWQEDASWPPGALRCETLSVSGPQRERIVLPWMDWAAVLAVAASAALFVEAVVRRNVVVVGAAIGLFLAATMAWFVEAAVLSWSLVGLAAAAAVAFSRSAALR